MPGTVSAKDMGISVLLLLGGGMGATAAAVSFQPRMSDQMFWTIAIGSTVLSFALLPVAYFFGKREAQPLAWKVVMFFWALAMGNGAVMIVGLVVGLILGYALGW